MASKASSTKETASDKNSVVVVDNGDAKEVESDLHGKTGTGNSLNSKCNEVYFKLVPFFDGSFWRPRPQSPI
jgi:hypothetical protein